MDSLHRTHLLLVWDFWFGARFDHVRRLCCMDKNDFSQSLSSSHFLSRNTISLSRIKQLLPPPSPTRTHSLSHRPQNLTLLPSLFSSLLPPKQVNKQHSHIHHNTNTNTNKDNNLVCLQSKPFKLAFENQDTPVREIKPKNRRIMVT